VTDHGRAPRPGRFTFGRIGRRGILLGLAALVVLILVVTGIRTAILASDLQEGRARLLHAFDVAEGAGLKMTTAQAGEIAADLRAADAALARAEVGLHDDPFVVWLRLLPILDRQLGAADTIVDAVRGVTRHHEVVDELLTGVIAARDGGSGSERLAGLAQMAGAHAADISALLAAIRQADATMTGLAPDGLVGPIATARTLLCERLEQARPLVSAVENGSRLAPSLLGVGDDKRYLLFALDNAEIRPIGGLIGAFARPRFTDGELSDLAFRDIQAVDRPDQREYVEPPGPLADHLLGEFTWQVADAGWWPDFAASVEEARRMYEVETGDGDFQGAIAFTPEFVDALLTIVGPVEIPEAGVTVHPGETYLVSLEQVEVLNRGEARKQFLADLASEVLTRLFRLDPERYPEVAAALDEAGKRRHLQIVVDDPEALRILVELGWYTPFTFPEEGDRLSIMAANVAPVSKLDALLEMEHALDVRLLPDGSADELLVTTLMNGFRDDLPPELERVRLAFRHGILGSFQRRYLDPAAEVLEVSGGTSGHPVTDPESLELESGSLAVGNYLYVPPGDGRLETTYHVPAVVISSAGDPAREGTYRLTFRKQPGRDHDTLRVSVTVPEGTVPRSWTDGGVANGSVVTFTTTTEFDRVFEVTYGTGS
jgi:hypothetical protein